MDNVFDGQELFRKVGGICLDVVGYLNFFTGVHNIGELRHIHDAACREVTGKAEIRMTVMNRLAMVDNDL